MFELNTRNVLIASAVALTATACAVAAVMWTTDKSWDQEAADKAHQSMLDAYDAAVAACAGDNNKASFAFELAASEIRKTFAEANAKFEPELAEWLKKFDDKVKVLKKDIRKA